jgi:uncharacterized protein (DUF2062 family)
LRQRLTALLHHLRTENADPARLACAVAIGLFVGVLPLYGLHLALCLGLAVALRLNKTGTVLASQISLPMFAPVLVAAGIYVGEIVRFGAVPDRFLSCLLGDALIGLVLGAVGGAITYGWARRRALRADTGG